MTEIKLSCRGAAATARVEGVITAGAVGIPVTISIEGEEWAGAAPRFIAVCGNVAKENVINAGHTTVPHECLLAGQRLFLGLDGWNEDGSVRIPTIWADCGMVKVSTAGVNPTNHNQPTRELSDQIYNLAYQANENVADLKRRADSGEFKGDKGDKGDVGATGPRGYTGQTGADGADGKSAYELAVQNGYTGSLSDWLASLKGDDGEVPDADKIIEVSETQPTAEVNQAWVDPNAESFEVPSWEAFEALKDDLAKSEEDTLFMFDGNAEYMIPTRRASFDGNNGVGANGTRTNRIITENIQIQKGDKIFIGHNVLDHGVGMWKGSISRQNLIRNDSAFVKHEETITVENDGYICIVFAKPDSSKALTLSEFDTRIIRIKTLNNDIIKQHESRIKALEADNGNLKAAALNVLYTEQTNATSGDNNVPAGSLPYSAINMVGGMSMRVVDDGLVSAEVDNVVSLDSNLLELGRVSIPEAIRNACPDYGIGISDDCYNYIDFAQKKYHHRIAGVDLGSLSWEYEAGNFRFASLSVTNVKYYGQYRKTPCISSIFDCKIGGEAYDSNWNNTLYFANKSLFAHAKAYTTVEAFVEAIAGQMLYYELANEEIIDLPDLPDGIITVEPGGTIRYHYPTLDAGYTLDVPNSMTYQISTKEAIANG